MQAHAAQQACLQVQRQRVLVATLQGVEPSRHLLQQRQCAADAPTGRGGIDAAAVGHMGQRLTVRGEQVNMRIQAGVQRGMRKGRLKAAGANLSTAACS